MPSVASSLFVLAALYGNATAIDAVSHPNVYAGTYLIRICKGPCAYPAPASYISGVLVLFNKPLRNNLGREFRAEFDRAPVNGCFVLKSPEVAGSFPEILPEGFFSWALFPADNTADMQLARSPDGGYAVSLKLVAKGLSGTGRSWGGAVGPMREPYLPANSVVADRVGEPDIERCPPRP